MTRDTPLALITGASGGIGRAFAEIHAARGGDLIVTARRQAELDTLKSALESAHGVSVTPVAADLGTPEGLATVLAACEGREIGILINNAGFGGRGDFVTRVISDDLAMIDLNIGALVQLCHAVGQRMVERGSGRILNVGSTAGMMPGPLQATYFATKAFVNSFSQALDDEMRPKGVTVTVLAPGYVETGFASRADLSDTPLTKSGATPQDVASFGYDAMMDGRLHVVNDAKLSFLTNWVIPFLPRRRVLKMVRDMQTK
ncbi:SDR family NAD(P)-dependent oxidoreductase [Jannaschia donghaensis]|uniref:3-oxoacyl-[acyl-carrier-protein] reductase FabG n=1 Tax=Jannaschia donghaensis TaxID=420998 RepID=A0A0M6YKH6_9RHOB|nr:SDR family oxidoreductase [Jannaschia donghaensis]CTQ49767.1 3-oxoacyl-[acyl-carrier-protein] reductase FabG [Jannaschia donghaensis]